MSGDISALPLSVLGRASQETFMNSRSKAAT